ncbi:hypothetical protein WN51_00761 [Melipona quadrifasciata]|uniref:EF-hand domain-containing protein n=1 Tax=Melipona quadrifasciata TaxID=166423 RepID=A0A0N1ITF2_9HYME|nr:hypothetical protein WN51_00761 [Melipona quadrifasciata]
MLLASGASIPTIAGTVEEEEEYARSEANSAHYDGYVTDHTDLASEIDIDESEYRRELLNDLHSQKLHDSSQFNYAKVQICKKIARQFTVQLLYAYKWRMLFDKFDPEGFGEIPVEDFLAALKSPEWKAEIPPNKRDILLTRAKESRVEAVTFQDFVNVNGLLMYYVIQPKIIDKSEMKFTKLPSKNCKLVVSTTLAMPVLINLRPESLIKR